MNKYNNIIKEKIIDPKGDEKEFEIKQLSKQKWLYYNKLNNNLKNEIDYLKSWILIIIFGIVIELMLLLNYIFNEKTNVLLFLFMILFGICFPSFVIGRMLTIINLNKIKISTNNIMKKFYLRVLKNE